MLEHSRCSLNWNLYFHHYYFHSKLCEVQGQYANQGTRCLGNRSEKDTELEMDHCI